MSTTLKRTDYVGRAYTFVYDELAVIAPLVILWSLPAALLEVWPVLNPEPFHALGRFAAENDMLWIINAVDMTVGAVQAVCIAGFSVHRHRALLGEGAPLKRSLIGALPPYLGYWLLTLLAFIFVSFAMGLACSVIFGQSKAAFLVATALTMIIIGMLVLRAVIVFPAIAVGDRNVTLLTAEATTRGNGWRIFLGSALVTIPNALAGGIAIGIPSYFLQKAGPGGELFASLAQLYLEYFVAAFFVTYVSLLYAHFTARPVPEPPSWKRRTPVFNY